MTDLSPFRRRQERAATVAALHIPEGKQSTMDKAHWTEHIGLKGGAPRTKNTRWLEPPRIVPQCVARHTQNGRHHHKWLGSPWIVPQSPRDMPLRPRRSSGAFTYSCNPCGEPLLQLQANPRHASSPPQVFWGDMLGAFLLDAGTQICSLANPVAAIPSCNPQLQFPSAIPICNPHGETPTAAVGQQRVRGAAFITVHAANMDRDRVQRP